MFNLLRRIVLLALVAIASPDAFAQIPGPASTAEWTISSAAARFVIEMDKNDQGPALSSVQLVLPNPAWATMPIRVFDNNGVAVSSDVLWNAPGEPLTLLFDSSSGLSRYYVYLGSTWPSLPLTTGKNGVCLESRAGDGKTVDNLPDMLKAWNQSKAIFGRGVVQGLFEGGHRFGPQGNILEYFRGWFNITDPTHLELAAITTDASFVLIDGREVVEWPGRHDFHPGLQGHFRGAIDLAPGVHSMEVYNAYVSSDERRPLLCCLAAKGGALGGWTMLMPDSHFFLPAGHAHIVNYERPTVGALATTPAFAMDWSINEQTVVAPDNTTSGFIGVKFSSFPQIGSATWTFDDGTTAEGDTVQHLFPRPGLRVVRLKVDDGDKSYVQSQIVNVHPNWTQLTTNRPELKPEHLADMMARDPAMMTASDLAGCVAVFAAFRNADALRKFIPAVGAKLKDFNDADLDEVRDAGQFLAREDAKHFAEAGQLLQALVDRCAAGKPSPEVVLLGNQARITLAQLMLKTSEKTEEVKALLDGVKVEALPGDRRRGYDVLRADLALASGNVEEARKQYVALTGDPSGADARSSIRRTGRIGQARAYLDRKDYDAAAAALRDVGNQAPIEKLSPDWALTQLRLYQEQGNPLEAYLWAKRLLPVIKDGNRSELLYRLAELAYAQNDSDLAGKCIAELLKKFPYSAEAARAKEKWPGIGT